MSILNSSDNIFILIICLYLSYSDKIKFKDKLRRFYDKKKIDMANLQKAKEEIHHVKFSTESAEIDSEEMKIQNDIIELDISGTHKIATSRSTLTKFPSSALGFMFNGKHKLK